MKLDQNICFIVFLTQPGFCCMWFYSSLVWTAAQDSPFSVSPLSCDLAPLKSTSFRVTYDPKQLNTLHAAQLECFACYKVPFIITSKNSIGTSDGAFLFGVNLSKKYARLKFCGNISSFEAKRFHAIFPAGQSLHRGATVVSTLVCDCQSHRPLLSARQRAFHPLLLPEASSSGETQAWERARMLQYIFLSHLSPLVCLLSIVLSFSQ